MTPDKSSADLSAAPATTSIMLYWTKDTGMLDLGTLGGTKAAAAGINNSGQ